MLVTVARFRDPWEAEMFRGRLEVEDIAAFVIHPYHIGMNWPWSRALHGVKVQVLRDDTAGALEVMGRCRSGAYSAELLELFGTLGEPQCPHCGSIEYRKTPSPAQIFFSFALFLATFIPVPPEVWRRTCRSCGTRWVE